MRHEELTEALARARDMPDGPGRIAELERIIAYADAAADARLGLDARFELIAAFNAGAERWRMLAPLGWCRTAFDRDPALFSDADTQRLRRYQRWAVASMLGTCRIGLAQTLATLEDMERRLRSGGHSLRAVFGLRCRIADHLGDEAAAREWLGRWRAAPRDEHSDCAGCEATWQTALLAGWGEWAEAVRAAEPVLQGVLGCVHQPEAALAAVMVPYLRLGRHEDAGHAHVLAYRRHRQERDGFPFLADHLRFCALTGHLDRGLDLLAEQLGRLDRPYDDVSAMEFAAAGALVCRLAAETDLGGRIVHRPAHRDRPAADLPVAALGIDLLAVAEDLAGRFDARNGTNHQSGRVAAWLAVRPVCAPVSLPAAEAEHDPAR
ncbi:MAG TPA: hypothetical protein VF174_09670 [Micromonosporaceae bacterium]